MVIHNSKTNRVLALVVTTGFIIAAAQGAHADANCDIHAAAMVAEMKASAAQPMSDQEVTLVRETARKSCLAQSGATTNAPVAAAPAVVATPQLAAPVAQAKPDNSFFGTLGGIFSGPTVRKPGNQRLLDRSQH